MEYLSPQGVLLPLVYGTTASPLWLELRGRSAWQATPSWTVYRLACHRLHPWLRVTFAMVPDAAWPGSDQQPWSTAPATGPVGRLGRPSVSDPWGVGSFLSPGRPTCVRRPGPPGSCSPVCLLGVLCCVCGVLGLPAPVHRCARSVWCVACAASWASRLLFTGAPARCVVLRVRRPGPPGSCSPVRPLGVLCGVCGVLGLPAPVHRCARWVCCVACAASWASRLLFTGAPARCVVLRVRRPGPPGSCSPVCPLGVLCCVCGVLGLPAPVHRCARSVCCVACAVSWASRLLFTGVPARCVVLRVRRPGPPGSCSPLCPLGVLCCVCGVLGLPAPVHRCARSPCCVACAASWASRLLFGGVPARCVVLRVRRPGPPGSCSPVCLLGVLCCVCGVLGLPAPVHRCACSVCCVACAASWASRLLFTGAPARCGVLCCVCGVLGLPAPVHRCARSVCCVACAASWASRLLSTGVPARRVVLRVRRPGPPGSCSPVCPFGVLCCVCGVLGLPAPVHRCARSVCCVACAASWASRLLFTGAPARCGVLCCVCGVLGLPAPVHRCARSVWCVVSRVRRPGPPGSCSPVCPLGVLCCVCGVLGLPAPVHRCARSVCCVACAVSWASRLLFTGAPARCVVLRVRRPGPPGSCSPVRPLGVVCCVACAASWASRLLFTGVPARCVVLRVRRPGPPGSCSPACPLGVLCCVCGVLGLPAPVHRCARSVCCVAVWGAAAGRSLVHPDGGYRSRQGLGTLRAHTRPSGRRLFVAGRGWVPSGRALVHPDGGCSLPAGVGYPPGAHSSIRTAAGVRVLALCGRVGRAGLPGALWCASPFPLAALSFCFAWPPPGWGCPPLSCCPCRSSLPWCRALVVFLGLPLPASSCARASFVSPAWPLAALWWFLPPPPPFLCLGVFVAPAWCLGVVFFFFFFFPFFSCAPPLSPAFSGFRPRVPWASALCVVCFVGLPPLGSPCACPAFVLSAWLVLAPRRLLPPPPPLFVSRFSSLPLGAVCRVLRCAVRPSLRCCAALCSLGAAACCAVPSVAARCPGALCSAALRFAVFPRAVCVLSWRGGACCCWPLCFVLCVSRGAVLCVLCPLRFVRCCASLCWCARVVLFVWCSLLLAPGAVVCRGAVLGLVARLSAGGVFRCPCLAAWSVSLWLVWFAVVPCFPVSCSVVLCCRVVLCCCALLSCCGAVGACFALLWAVVLCCVVLLVGCAVFCPVVVAACCGALFLVLCVPCLLRSVRCGALLCWLWCLASLCRVLWRCAVVWCCAVVLCCRFAVLFVFAAARRAAPVSCALLLVPRAVACPCALWCLLGRSAVWWCCSGVSWCLAVLCVVLWCPASCAVSCGAVLRDEGNGV